MQCHTTTGRTPNAQKLDGQTQTGLLPMPQTPPTDNHTTSLLSTTADTTTDSSTPTRNNQSRLLQTKQRLIALPTAPYPTSEWTDPDMFLLHCDSLTWLVTPICAMWTDEGWTKTAKSMSERLGEVQPVISQLAWPNGHPERTLAPNTARTLTMASNWSLSASGR